MSDLSANGGFMQLLQQLLQGGGLGQLMAGMGQSGTQAPAGGGGQLPPTLLQQLLNGGQGGAQTPIAQFGGGGAPQQPIQSGQLIPAPSPVNGNFAPGLGGAQLPIATPVGGGSLGPGIPTVPGQSPGASGPLQPSIQQPLAPVRTGPGFFAGGI